MFLLAGLAVGYGTVGQMDKLEHRLLSGQDDSGRTSWQFSYAARALLFTRYEYLPTPLAQPIGMDPRKWEENLWMDNVISEQHWFWRIDRRRPVFPEHHPALTDESSIDSCLGYSTRYEIAREGVILGGVLPLAVILLFTWDAVRSRRRQAM